MKKLGSYFYLSEVKPFYEFEYTEKEKIIEARRRQLIKYRNSTVKILEKLKMIEGVPKMMATVTADKDYWKEIVVYK